MSAPESLAALLGASGWAAVVVLVVLLAGVAEFYRRSRARRPPPASSRDGQERERLSRQVAKVSEQLGDLRFRVDALRQEFSQNLVNVNAGLRDVQETLSARGAAPAPPVAASPARAEPYGSSWRADAPDPYAETYSVSSGGEDPNAGWADLTRLSSGRPVEIRDGALVPSQSLPPDAYLLMGAQGRGQVVLNPEAEINEFALPKWSSYFDLRGARPFARYRTTRAAIVQWDSAAERGSLQAAGEAEAL